MRLKDHPTKRKALLQLCKTRWAELHKAFQYFYQAYTFIVEALEAIGHDQRLELQDTMFSDWGTDNCSSAQQILSSITNFEFIVVFLLVYQYLSHLSGITVQLQGTTVDIIEAYTLISATKESCTKRREKRWRKDLRPFINTQ